MKRVVEYRKLLEVDKNVTLKELKTIYRNSMKETHPDKFVNDEEVNKQLKKKANLLLVLITF